MADLTFFYLLFSLDPIIGAYKAGRDAIRAEITKAEAAEDGLTDDIKAGKTERYSHDEETGQEHDAIEYAYFTTIVAKKTLNQHAQAFTVMLYHAWEKHVCNTKGWKKLNLPDGYYILEREGWQIDRSGLGRLRKAINCIKHIDTELFRDHKEMFDLSEIDVKRDGIGGIHEALRVTDDDVMDFIDVIKSSAQRPSYRTMREAKAAELRA